MAIQLVSALTINGQLSSSNTLLDVQGSVGQLFSVTDSLSGDLFAVSDISGIPILNVNSSGAVDIDGSLTVDGTVKFEALTSGILEVDSSGNLSVDTSTYLTSINNSNWSGTDLSVANGGTGASTASAARTNLGLGTAATSASTDFVAVTGGTMTGQVIFPSAATTRPVLPNGFISRNDNSDTNDRHDIWGISERYYPSNSTTADAWGIQWSGTPNDVVFVGGGEDKVTISLDEGNITTIGTVTASGGNSTNWNTAYGWGNHASANYLTAETFSSSDVAIVLSGNDIIAGTSITLAGGLSYNSSTNTLSQTDNNTVYTHPTFNGDDFSIDTGALTGATVISDLDINITTNSEGHVTDANASVATRNLTAADIGAAASSHTHAATDITSGTLSNDRLNWNVNNDFSGTYSLLWNASNSLYTASWLQVRGSDDTLLTRNIAATGDLNIDYNGIAIDIANTEGSGADTGIRIRGARNGQNFATDVLTSYALFSNYDNNTSPNSYDLAKIGAGMHDSDSDTGYFQILTNNGTALTKALAIDKNQDSFFYGDIDSTGDITASNLNVSNWDTAYGWGNHGSVGYLTTATAATTYAPLASPALTGTPTAPTAAAATNTTQLATTAFVSTAIANLTDSAPATLNTLNELAAALGDDANFSTTTATSLGNRLRVDTASQGLTDTQKQNARTNLDIDIRYASAGRTNAHTSFSNLNDNPSVLGWSYYTGTTNSPHDGSQGGYKLRIGLGSDYGTNSGTSGHYSMEMLMPRTTQASNGVGYLYMRQMEGGVYDTWSKIKSGYADSAGSVAYSNVTGTPTLGTAASTASTDYATAAQGTTADAALPKGTSTIGSGVHLNLKHTTTTGYSEMSMSNDANHSLVFGSIGSAYTNTAWAGSRYIYSTAGELRIKAATNLRLYSGGMSHTGNLAVTFDSSQDATFTGSISADNFSGSSSGTNTGDQTLPTLSSLGALSTSGGTLSGDLTMSSPTPTLKFSINGAENNAGIVWEDGDAGDPSAQAAAIKWSASDNIMRFYNNDESAERMRIATDGTVTFANGIVASGGIAGLTLANGGISGTNYNITGVNQLEIADPGEGIVFKSGSSGDMTLAIVDDSSDNILRFSGTNATFDVAGVLTVASSITTGYANISNQQNTDVDTGTETIASVAHATYTAAFFDYVIKNGTNVRAGIIYACHDGTNVEFNEVSTVDLGDTSDVTLEVDISGTDMRLRATTTSNNWSVKSLVRAI